MENYTYEGSNQRKIEIFLLIVHSIYSLGMCESYLIRGISTGMEFYFLLLVAVNWIVCVSKCKDYLFRAKVSAIMMQGSMFLYATQAKEVSEILSVFLVFVVVLGLYGVAKIINITAVSIMLIFAYHIFISQSIEVNSMRAVARVMSQLGNVLIMEYIVYVWVKRNYEGSKKLLDTIKELRLAESSKNDFLANVSHEIRTPINTICGMSEIVIREEIPHKIRENVQSIERAGRELMSVVGDILDYSELQSGKIELQEEAYNITSMLNDVINMALAKKGEKKIELIVDCDATLPSALKGDEKKIRRVIMNLVDNAIKFTNEGYISIQVGYRKESYGINLIVAVKDSGIGMDEKSLEKLFVEFSQGNGRRNRQEGGVGLGLAISNALVRTMGGAITVRSKIGKGSVVQFAIPQKVLEETHVAAINNKENVNVATYIDMEQFGMEDIRDEYSKSIVHMVEQLRVKCSICRNFTELQRRQDAENFSHIFISILEYRADREYFDKLAAKTKVIVVLDREDEKYIINPQVLKIYKPFYILTIVSVLNGLYDMSEDGFAMEGNKFVTENAHILVVDDNRMNIRVIEGLLEDYKIKVSIANSGKEALEKIVSQNYDFVFMDHMMPEMDGVEALHRIRHKVGTYYQQVPIVALTANAVAGNREMLLKEGFSDFLEKPVERSVLERVLKRNLPEEKIIYKKSLSKEETDKLKDTPVVKEGDKEEKTGIPSVEELERSLGPKGLDVRKGIVYCNGMEQYIKVLQGYCEDCDESGLLAEQLFIKKDWKNYVIAVHGMKGAMRSIGAVELSELARKLEYAGKEDRISYIMEHHDELMAQYRNFFISLKENKWIVPVKPKEKVIEEQNEELLNLDSAEFDQIIKEMEDAMYALDGETLLALVTALQKYKYGGKALKEQLSAVKRKIEMSDYFSAVEMVVRIRKSLTDEVS